MVGALPSPGGPDVASEIPEAIRPARLWRRHGFVRIAATSYAVAIGCVACSLREPADMYRCIRLAILSALFTFKQTLHGPLAGIGLSF